MNTRDQFGSYLLLKKVGEDALGESFRAGKIGRQGVERVLLLRVFNGQGLDSARLAQHLAAQGPALQALKSPNLGLCVDSGQVGGVPFVAWDYISGKSLAALLDQARRKHSPVPFDHALLIAERAAMGLAVAYETRLGDERVLHGFLAPHLVMISNEGETRLLGFEAAGGLRGSASHPLLREAFGRYLAPEVVAGQPRHKADDVYTLGAIFFELLTGERIPPGASGGLAAAVDAATLPNEGTPIPAPIADLLKQSLAPRDQRLADAPTWHKTLSKQMADGHYNPTTFNLAFYMHSLFRDEIDKEGQEIEAEKTIQLSAEQLRPATAAAVPAAAAAPAATPSRSLEDEYGLPSSSAKKGGLSPAVIGGAAAAVVVLAVGGYLAFGRGGAPAAAPAVTTPAPAAVAAGPSPEEIQKQIEKMLEEKLKAREAGMKSQYDDQIKAMQARLEEAQKAAAEQAKRPAAGATTAVAALPTPAAVPTAVPMATLAVATPTPAPAATATAVAEAPKPTPAPVAAATVAAATAAPAAAAGSVRPGDLVTMGPGVIPPKTIKLGAQRYPPAARRMNREATVAVRVLVSENGKVIDTQVPTKIGLGFDEAAQETARLTTFVPATKNGVPVRMWMELKIAFSLK